MLKSIRFSFLSAVFLLLLANPAFADSGIKLYHKIIDIQQSGDYQTLSLQLTIDNLSTMDLHRVKLSPTGGEFSAEALKNLVNIGNLPSMGQSVIQWTVKTPLAAEYFSSGMPVFFVMKAKKQNGEDIEVPVYSHGDATL